MESQNDLEVTKGDPIYSYPAGSTKMIRGEEDKLAATDTPGELPVKIRYERHMARKFDPQTGGTAKDLLGWTVNLDCYMFSTQVVLKLCRSPRRMEIWVDGVKVSVADKPFNQDWVPDPTIGIEIPVDFLKGWFDGGDLKKTHGWATKLGEAHQVEKQIQARKAQPKIEPTEPHCSKCWKLDEGDLVDKDDKQYCMVCFLTGGV